MSIAALVAGFCLMAGHPVAAGVFLVLHGLVSEHNKSGGIK